ncbi:hypothetical protein IQ07DRAFT_649260 [Pyrenochaeta sp. DS3sAY3a]|nr:hypothetical protein IQ07DRAFT_649260 [Pyrenochaeta sp. DS3sAY3a]
MVHTRRQAPADMGQSDPPGHAEVTTFTTDGTTLNMYAHYAIPSEEDEDTLKYHRYQYASTNIKDSYQGHKDGWRGLRNAQDHAKTQSYALRDQLKDHWKQQHGAFHLTLHPNALIANKNPRTRLMHYLDPDRARQNPTGCSTMKVDNTITSIPMAQSPGTTMATMATRMKIDKPHLGHQFLGYRQ